MNFKDLLTVLLDRIEGAVAAFFCGTDGIGVENVVLGQNVETSVTEVEIATALKVITDVSDNLNFGNVSGFFLESDTVTAIVEKIQSDYFLCVLLKNNSNIGRGRLELKKLAAKINREL
jgi:predicted regulator of Ras-like GTPase activity (Roadblock/LC7/MglB family)